MITLYGIRHHGPGCARGLLAALERLAPDVILLEMPPEAEPLLPHVADAAMQPPVAVLIHRVDAPERAAFFPFATFSPEWQALRWAGAAGVPVRCFDLPYAHITALRDAQEEDSTASDAPGDRDAFEWFARADGYTDSERWWNDKLEERQGHEDFFEAILEAVTALRGELALPETRETLLREAWMRRCVRAAENDGFQNIAVVCGAWHVPALVAKVKVSEDNELLKNLPRHKVAATWIPWTADRLGIASGYSAGIVSPGWYRHLWEYPADPIPPWLTRAARILRAEGQEASSASVIEATRLADSLAGMRGRPRPGLDETLEAIQAIFCQGDPFPLGFLRKKLLIGDELGELPEGLPTLPLRQDIEATLKRLRLKPAASLTPLELDLREDGGRARSVFLHRLLALRIPWGRKEQEGRARGTFKERWVLQWKPELEVSIIDAAAHGNTVEAAAGRALAGPAADGATLADVTARLDLALLGALPAAVDVLLRRLDAVAATTGDILELLATIPPLARIARYGDVRATDGQAVSRLLSVLAARIHAGLPAAASCIDEEAAATLGGKLGDYRGALALLEAPALTENFHATLGRLADSETAHPRLRGQATRILRDSSLLEDAEAARHLGFALSPGMPPLAGASWLEGFLEGGGSLLVHDHALLALIDGWLTVLDNETFQNVLPLLLRTFGTFGVPERERIAHAIRHPRGATAAATETPDLDFHRALPAVTAVANLLRLSRVP